MGRWTQFDEDDYRLPEGMRRIGYDADTGRYYFRDGNGGVWKSEEGSDYGELTKVSELPSSIAGSNVMDDGDVEAASTHSNGYHLLNTDPNSTMARNLNSSAYRTLFPFFLIIAVVLLLVWRLVLSPGLSTRESDCSHAQAYTVQLGDSCWDVARAHNISLDDLRVLNPKLQCEPLIPGSTICLPKVVQ